MSGSATVCRRARHQIPTDLMKGTVMYDKTYERAKASKEKAKGRKVDVIPKEKTSKYKTLRTWQLTKKVEGSQPSWEDFPNKAKLLSVLLSYVNYAEVRAENRDYTNTLEMHGLVVLEDDDLCYLTEKGDTLVSYLINVPLPVSVTTWSMPDRKVF